MVRKKGTSKKGKKGSVPSRTAAASTPLESIRRRIDAVDAQLHALINERAGLARQVGISKHVDGHTVDFYRPEREARSEEHTSELQSQSNLVCRLLLEKK